MYPDELYQLAFAFRKTSLWRSLGDGELFAVELPDGEIGYCCVRGFGGQEYALSLYVGEEGLDSFWACQDLAMGSNLLKAYEAALSRACLQCSFGNKERLNPEELLSVRAYASEHEISFRGPNAFPEFTNYYPARSAALVSQPEESRLLCAALDAALEVSRQVKSGNRVRLGFQRRYMHPSSIPLLARSGEGFVWDMHPLPNQSAQYPEPSLQDELLMKRLKEAAERCDTWVCDAALVPCPMAERKGAAPIFPYTILAEICETRKFLPLGVVPDLKEGAETLLQKLGNRMLENQIPEEILVADRRTYALLKNLAKELDIKLTLQPDNDVLNELEDRFLGQIHIHFMSKAKNNPEFFICVFLGMEDNAILSMPDDLWEQLRSMEQQNMLDEDTAERLRTLSKQREQSPTPLYPAFESWFPCL